MTNTWGQPGAQQPGTPQSGWQPAQQPTYPPPPAPPYAPQASPYAPPPAPQPPAGDAPSRSNARFFVGLAAGIAIPVIVGVVLLLTGVLHVGSTSDDAAAPAVDTTPVTMPDTLGGLRLTNSVAAEKSPKTAERFAATNERTAALTVDAYTKAYGGAATGVQMYAADDLEALLTVIAVRAESPRMTNGPVNDPADLGVATLPQAVEQFGEVDCLIVTMVTVKAGDEVNPENQRAVTCQRTGPDGTVVVTGNAGDGPTGQSTMIAMTNAAYDTLSPTG